MNELQRQALIVYDETLTANAIEFEHTMAPARLYLSNELR